MGAKNIQDCVKKIEWLKKKHYVKELDPTWMHDEKAYLRVEIKGKAKILIAQLMTRSHHLRCETSRWITPKEEWKYISCIYYSIRVVEI